MLGNLSRRIRRFTRWLFGAPLRICRQALASRCPRSARSNKKWTRLNIAHMAKRQHSPSGGTNVPGRPGNINNGGENGHRYQHTALGPW